MCRKPAAVSQACWRGVVGVRAGVEQGGRHAAHPGDVDGVPLTGAEEGEGERGGRRLLEERRDRDLDERAAGGPVVHREPRDESAAGVVDERLPPGPRARAGQQHEDGVGVHPRRTLRRPLVRGEQGGDLGHVRRGRAPGR